MLVDVRVPVVVEDQVLGLVNRFTINALVSEPASMSPATKLKVALNRPPALISSAPLAGRLRVQ